MRDRIEEFLFKAPLASYVDGTLSIDWSWPTFWLVVFSIAIAIYLLLGFLSLTSASSAGRSTAIWLIRTLLISTCLLIFLNPVLRVDSDEPTPARLAVVVDDSLSMSIADGTDENSRGATVKTHFSPTTGSITQDLEERFVTEYFRFSNELEKIESAQMLTFAGGKSNLSGALAKLAAGQATTIVLVSDGASQQDKLDDALDALAAAGKRVFTVGVGEREFEREIDIVNLELSKRILVEDTVIAELRLQHRGYGGESLELVVEDDGVIIEQQSIVVPSNRDNFRIPVTLRFDSPGPRQLSFQLSGTSGDLIEGNNVIKRSVDVSDDRYRILHFEGEPRFEVKFIRRAIMDDTNVRVTSLIRTAENKYFRLELEEEDELADGFPKTREELYRYDGVILGSVNRTLMSDERLELLKDFVSVRGGGLLLLGGAGAFAEGGYDASVLEQMLPFELDSQSRIGRAEVLVYPTRQGLEAPLLSKLIVRTPTPSANVSSSDAPVSDAPVNVFDLWKTLPRLTMVNAAQNPKPGATVLLEGVSEDGQKYPVLTQHRYGRGTVIALPVRDTWRWQINEKIAPDDTTHESFWRRLLRALVINSRQSVEMQTRVNEAVNGQTVSIDIKTNNDAFEPATMGDDVIVSVTTPSGVVKKITADPVSNKTGYYRANLLTEEAGRYEFKTELPQSLTDKTDTGTSSAREASSESPTFNARAHVDVSPTGAELRDAEMKEASLRYIAERSGGRYFNVESLDELPGSIDAIQSLRRVSKQVPLSDAPFLLLILLFLIVCELALRQRWRFA